MTEEHLFDLILNASQAERAALLDRECAGNPDLRARIEALLEADARPLLTIDSPVNHTQSFTGTSGEAGTVIAGKYRLVELIGEGGMGSVWLAQQSEPVKRNVAVKLIKAGMDSKQVIARFEAERQALAVMDHPNIAKILDGGLHDSRPFFVMELVKGVPITQYCDAKKLTPRERLELFVPVCQAIQHAHQKGIIHRDIKPSNVLIAPYDDRPVPKVIDFGLAKATGVALIDASQATNFGGVVGTPQYMSPEQASLNNLDIDTRSDVYSLGVLLYELLTGSPPFKQKELEKAGMLEILRVIREVEPQKPSTKLSTADALPSLSAERSTEPKKLTGILRNELDWIVMKALEKDRARRYETANGFAADINRYLSGEPVNAHPPSAGYRMKKLLRKHKGPVIAASLVALALIVGIIGTGWGLVRAEQARADEAAQRVIAVEQRARAEKARDRTRDVLDAMTSSVTGDSLSTQTEISADQKKFLAEVLTYYREFAGERADDEKTRFRTANAAYRVGHIEYRLGRTEQGIAAYEMARDASRKLTADFPNEPAYDQILANSLHNLGALQASLGKRAVAEEQYREALAIQEKLAAEFPPVPNFRQDLANSHTNLGNLLNSLEKRTAAEEQFRKALAIREKLTADFPSEPTYQQDLAHSRNCLGTMLARLGRPAEAEEQFNQALDIVGKLAADFPNVPNYRQALAQNHNSMANLFSGLKKQAAAEEQVRNSLAIQEKLAADFPSGPAYRHALAGSHNNLGIMLHLQGKPAETEEQFRKSLAIQEKLAADFPAVTDYQIELGGGYCNFGELVRHNGRFGESVGWYDKAIATLAPVLRAEPRDAKAKLFLSNSHNDRALAYVNLKRYAEAAKDWDRVIELCPPAELFDVHNGRANARLHAGLVAEAVAEVAELTKTPNLKAEQWYNFACFYAFVSNKNADKKQEYTDRSMELLHKALKAGYKDAAHMKKDTDLDPLRDREDFKNLIAELEAKAEKK